MTSVLAAVIAGGKGSRMGRPKAKVTLDGETLLRRTVSAALDQADAVTCVAALSQLDEHDLPWLKDNDVSLLVEDPPLAGPAAALAVAASRAREAGLEWVIALAVDLATPAAVLETLVPKISEADDDVDGIAPIDQRGYVQWLAAAYRTDVLAQHLAKQQTANQSLHSVLTGLRLATFRNDHIAKDMNTAEQLARAADPAAAQRADHDLAAEEAAWQDWIQDVSKALGIDARLVDVAAIHDLTRHIAHNLTRPMAPVGALMLGVALANGVTQDKAVEVIRASIEAHRGEDA